MTSRRSFTSVSRVQGGLIQNRSFLQRILSFHHVRFKTQPVKATSTAVRFSARARPVCRGGFSQIDRSFRGCLSRNCALCVLDSRRGRTGHVQVVFRSENSGVPFATMGHAVRRKFTSSALHVYFFASRRLFSHFRGFGLGDSGTQDKGVALSLGRLGRFSRKSCVMRVSRNMKRFKNLMHARIGNGVRRTVGLVCRGGSVVFIDVRSLRGLSGCGKGRDNRPPGLDGLNANT